MYKDYLSGNKSAQPNERSFNTVMDAWARSGGKGAAKRCETILNGMIKVAEKNNLPVKPNTVSYNTVIIAYAREGQPREAERVLQMQYEDYKAGNKRAAFDLYSFNAIIRGWAQSKEDISGERAELILNHMLGLHKDGVLIELPNVFTCTAIINTWTVLGKADNAKLVFDRMMDDYKRARPDAATYSSLCEAIVNGRDKNAGEKADSLLRIMDYFGVKLQLSEWISTIKCWEVSLQSGHPRAKERVLDLQKVIDRLRKKS